jgi:hypothetical protein
MSTTSRNGMLLLDGKKPICIGKRKNLSKDIKEEEENNNT